jgi:diguanylate cyclase (GGDEF)-like protein
LLPQAGEEDALRILTRLAQHIKEIRVPVSFSKAKEVRLTASIGISMYPADGATLETLLEKADEALYWVKSKGRNAVAAYRSTHEKP